jgi:hypothetical protein
MQFFLEVRMIISADELTLIQRVLDLANLRDMRSARLVESLFKDEPLVKKFPLWRQVNPTDLDDFKRMNRNLRQWLDTLIGGTAKQRDALQKKIVLEFQQDCAEQAVVAGAVALKTWGIPTLRIDQRRRLEFGVVPLLTGVQSAVWYALILLFAKGLSENIVRCTATRRDAASCGNYYIKSKRLRVACSERCKRILRSQQVYRAVKKARGRTKYT